MDEQHLLPDSLALGDGQSDFVLWLLSESHQLHPWSVLACLRNVVVHGVLRQPSAQQWGLGPIYDAGVVALHTLFRRLLAATVGSAEVIHA